MEIKEIILKALFKSKFCRFLMLHFLPEENDYWIALRRRADQTWRWINDSRTIEDDSEIWLEGEPNDTDNEDCAVLTISNGTIGARSVHCNNSTEYYGLCERQV